jgi:hypothetical protein
MDRTTLTHPAQASPAKGATVSVAGTVRPSKNWRRRCRTYRARRAVFASRGRRGSSR